MVFRAASDAADVTDDVLLARYAGGDTRAATLLAERHGGRMIGLAWRLLNDRAEAEDVAQDAMLRLWRMAPTWEPGRAQVSSWLYQVVTNLCTDRLRKRRRLDVGLDHLPDPPDPAPSADEKMQQTSREAALNAALVRLPDRQRQAVVLRHIEGWTNPDIAAAMDISVEAVESLTARGKRALAEALAGRRADLGFEHD